MLWALRQMSVEEAIWVALPARFAGRDHGRTQQHDGRKCRRRMCVDGSAIGHGERITGGPRMCSARAKVSMMSIGAPQCRHRNVGLWER